MRKKTKRLTTRQRNKFERRQLERQKEIKRGKFTKHTAPAMSGAVGRPMYYMNEKNDIKEAKLKRIIKL